MNNFNKVINKAVSLLKEETPMSNPTLKKAIDGLATATQGNKVTDPNAKQLAGQLFQTPESTIDITTPLGKAVKNLHDALVNKKDPVFTPEEHAALDLLIKNTAPQKAQETDAQKQQNNQQSNKTAVNTTTSTQSTAKSTQPVGQPNATQYNPSNQSK